MTSVPGLYKEERPGRIGKNECIVVAYSPKLPELGLW